MITVESIDISGLNRVMAGIQGALIGMGQEGDASQVVKQTAKLLAQDIANQVGPKTRSKGEVKAAKSAVRVFSPIPRHHLSVRKSKGDGVVWLAAGPQFIEGVPDAMYKPDINNMSAMAHFSAPLIANRTLGKARKVVGRHGKQTVYLRNRIVIQRGTYKRFQAYLKSHAGRMKASFMQTYQAFGGKAVPAWIARHFPTPKAITDDSGLSDVNPFVRFGSTSRGVNRYNRQIQTALKIRTAAMYRRLELILSGYAQDANMTGRVHKQPHKFDNEG